MNSLTVLTVLTVVAVAWALRAMYLDMARARRAARRLAVANDQLRQDNRRLLEELDLHVEALTWASRERHPSNVRVLRSVDGGRA